MELLAFKNRQPEGIRLFRVQLAILVIIYTLVVYAGIYALTRTLMFESLRAQGASYFALIVDVRNWNASHGGVWVLKTGNVESNPFLEKLGITPDIRTETGATLTMRNPAAMTREVSELTRQRSGVSFHLTSLDYLNPVNAPDAWEKTALDSFYAGGAPRSGVDEIDGERYFRYAAPLLVDETCLGCHGQQGYEVGDSRGAITISIPMEGTDGVIARAGYFLSGMAVLTLLGALVTLRLLVARMESRIAAVNDQLTKMAITDALTGVLNRGATFSRLEQEFERSRRVAEPLSIVMLDLDHFKRVNDAWGHAAGDCALRSFTLRASDAVRTYDVVGRIGGEEFLVIAPGADGRTARGLAERILEQVRAIPVDCGGGISLTASAGVATLLADDTHIDTLLARADTALYAAKDAGRDRVKSAPEPGDVV